MTLLTRDATRYRTVYPTLELVCPWAPRSCVAKTFGLRHTAAHGALAIEGSTPSEPQASPVPEGWCMASPPREAQVVEADGVPHVAVTDEATKSMAARRSLTCRWTKAGKAHDH